MKLFADGWKAFWPPDVIKLKERWNGNQDPTWDLWPLHEQNAYCRMMRYLHGGASFQFVTKYISKQRSTFRSYRHLSIKAPPVKYSERRIGRTFLRKDIAQ
ncbi:MAG: hypothetical protein Pars92KO_30920 [Parasphingorhabdus sp.]